MAEGLHSTVQELYPELVGENDDGTLTVAYDRLSIIALVVIDTLKKENDELNEKVEDLEWKVRGLCGTTR